VVVEIFPREYRALYMDAGEHIGSSIADGIHLKLVEIVGDL
jgi:hypothetical protein